MMHISLHQTLSAMLLPWSLLWSRPIIAHGFLPLQPLRRPPIRTSVRLRSSLVDYSPAATALFNNMKTPAIILAAGMISIGFLAPFQLPESVQGQTKMVRRIELLKRAYITVTLISFCSELLVVMWATVAVNQLTERVVAPSSSVWDLLQRDCDLSWAAVNSHFVVGLVGFMYMVGIRGYIMLLAAEASEALIAATLTGVAAALLLMVSVVNRGVEAGGGEGIGYGATVLDLFAHYATLLYERAVNVESFGPLELSAIILELVSIACALYAVLSPGVFGTPERRIGKDKNQGNVDLLGNSHSYMNKESAVNEESTVTDSGPSDE